MLRKEYTMMSNIHLDEQVAPASHEELLPEADPASELREAALSGLGLSELIEQCVRQMSAYRRGEPSTDAYGVELLRRATIGRDLQAWMALQQCLAEVVLSWLRAHPSREVAVRLDSEENYVALAFERFWWATTQSQQIQFRSFAAALQYLRASLHGALLDTVRAYVRPKEIPLPEPGESGEPWAGDSSEGQELWEVIRRLLPNQREQRLAYLLFHWGLKPREIVHFCPQEFRSVEDIYRLRRNIVERLMRHADSIRWQLSPCEPWEEGLP
jgi:hypothetical protein